MIDRRTAACEAYKLSTKLPCPVENLWCSSEILRCILEKLWCILGKLILGKLWYIFENLCLLQFDLLRYTAKVMLGGSVT